MSWANVLLPYMLFAVVAGVLIAGYRLKRKQLAAFEKLRDIMQRHCSELAEMNGREAQIECAQVLGVPEPWITKMYDELLADREAMKARHEEEQRGPEAAWRRLTGRGPV